MSVQLVTVSSKYSTQSTYQYFCDEKQGQCTQTIDDDDDDDNNNSNDSNTNK